MELENGRPVLSTNVYELLEGFTGRRIDTQVLGKAFEPEEYFENRTAPPSPLTKITLGTIGAPIPCRALCRERCVGQPLW